MTDNTTLSEGINKADGECMISQLLDMLSDHAREFTCKVLRHHMCTPNSTHQYDLEVLAGHYNLTIFQGYDENDEMFVARAQVEIEDVFNITLSSDELKIEEDAEVCTQS